MTPEAGHPAIPWSFSQSRLEPHHRYLLPAVLKRLAHLPASSTILDLGCGSGYFSMQLMEAGYRVSGVDISESGIRAAKSARPDARFEVASVTDPSLPQRLGETFDAIVCIEVIEHLYSPAALLANCRLLLSAGGLLVLSTPYHGYLKYLLLAAAGRLARHLEPASEGGHIKFWTRSSLSEFLTRHGFDVGSIDGCGRVPFLWKSMVVSAERSGE